MQKDRGEILLALLAANGGKMLAKEARKRMRLSEPRFSLLLRTLADEIESGDFGKRSIDNLKIVCKKEGGKSLECRREKIANRLLPNTL
jgi:hypothetical protein